MIEERLNSSGGEKAGHASDHGRGAGGILSQRIGDTRLLSSIVGAVGEQARVGVRTSEGKQERSWVQSQKDALGALGDGIIGVRGKDGQQLGAIFRGKRAAAGTNDQLPFGPGAPRANFFAEFRANGRLLRAA
jgi:hypothetical protein